MMIQQYEDCIRACLESLETCNTCFTSCLKEEHIDMMRECIKLDRQEHCQNVRMLVVFERMHEKDVYYRKQMSKTLNVSWLRKNNWT